MKKIRRLMYLALVEYEMPSSGVHKKIQAEIENFENKNFKVDLYTFYNNDTVLIRNDNIVKVLGDKGRKTIFSSIINSQEAYDYLYIRHCACDWNYLRLLKKYRNANIYVEIATYPYKVEYFERTLGHIKYMVDFMFWHLCNKYIDRIIVYSEDKKVYGVPTIQTINGYDFDNTYLKENTYRKGEIKLVFVAFFDLSHGLDRLVLGLNDYYQKERNIKIKLDVIGAGYEYEKYKEYVSNNNQLRNYIKFEGKKTGSELGNLISSADIGVCSLAAFRHSQFLSSELKSREYGAYGLPMIGEAKIDFIGLDNPFYLKFSSNEQEINMKEILQFYKNVVSIKDYNEKIRELTIMKCSMDKTMDEVIKRMLYKSGDFNE